MAYILTEEIELRLKRLSKNTGRSEISYIEEALGEYLQDMEDYYLAAKTLKDLEEGRDEIVPIEEVMKKYGMDILK